MKKLLTFVSAITAGAIGTAAAEVSVSGAGNFYYSSASGDVALATQEKTMTVSGGAVNFAMSTETTNGITVTGSASITQDSDDVNYCWCWWCCRQNAHFNIWYGRYDCFTW